METPPVPSPLVISPPYHQDDSFKWTDKITTYSKPTEMSLWTYEEGKGLSTPRPQNITIIFFMEDMNPFTEISNKRPHEAALRGKVKAHLDHETRDDAMELTVLEGELIGVVTRTQR